MEVGERCYNLIEELEFKKIFSDDLEDPGSYFSYWSR